MLGRLEMTVEDCIAAYLELMKTVFKKKSRRFPLNTSGNIKAQFDSAKLKKAVEKVVVDSGASMADPLNDGRERGCKV